MLVGCLMVVSEAGGQDVIVGVRLCARACVLHTITVRLRECLHIRVCVTLGRVSGGSLWGHACCHQQKTDGNK